MRVLDALGGGVDEEPCAGPEEWRQAVHARVR
jgi:hypothetical protein